jgi:hypothetical protein
MITLLLIMSILALVAVATWCVRAMDREMRGLGDDQEDESHTDGIELGREEEP